ncbi:MAG: 2'-deoxycytidine 5'-triphosphate deaminase [Alphaproteobacteria bacterium]|nr:2'-deoxycytidine 5'-triphosphate deaminase [Alphaproteobacteria bacterium]
MASPTKDALFPEARPSAAPRFTTGILPYQSYLDFVKAGRIAADLPFADNQVQPASIDLRLGPVAYRVQASFLPGNQPVMRKIGQLKMHELDLTQGAVLERGCIYIVPLLERLNLPADIAGTANPKSTTGRLDIFTRLIPDYAEEFEKVKKGYKGSLYLEVSPRTFSVRVHQGLALNQLRLRRGDPPPSDTALEALNESEGLIFSANQKSAATIRRGLWVSIDLQGTDGDIIGYRARHHTALIDLAKVGHYDPKEYWEPIARNAARSLILNPGEFYILVSKEQVRVPSGFAAEMVPYDPSVGEFRIHYAGFFDPGFGYGQSGEIPGTRAVLEVRSHEVPFLLEDAQVVGRLIYERLTDPPEKLYGVDLKSNYQCQGLALSKHFRRD